MAVAPSNPLESTSLPERVANIIALICDMQARGSRDHIFLIA